jgi:hypothetical protein
MLLEPINDKPSPTIRIKENRRADVTSTNLFKEGEMTI